MKCKRSATRRPRLGRVRRRQAGGSVGQRPRGGPKAPNAPCGRQPTESPPPPGDSEDAECAVFYFGVGQGGTVKANVDRWFRQFEQPDGQPSSKVAKVEEQTINGLKITTVSLAGTYLASRGPMAQQATAKPGFHMLAAIVEAPQGPVFFKLTGPSKTVLDVRTEFEGFLQTLKRN